MQQIYFLYFFIVFVATTAGAIAGMGGGVIIKPVLDFLGHFPVSSINILSSVSVFSMTAVSVIKQIRTKAKIDYSISVSLGMGAIFGGLLGERLINYIIKIFVFDSGITVMQNAILIFVVAISIYFVKNKEKIKTKQFSGIIVSSAMGLFLGMVSSFLSIGGGPLNVAFIMYFFSFDIKQSVVYSIVIIFFSQLSKLIAIAASGGFPEHDLSVMPFMIIGAILGGWVGSAFNKKLSEKNVKYFYITVQIAVIIISAFNLFKIYCLMSTTK